MKSSAKFITLIIALLVITLCSLVLLLLSYSTAKVDQQMSKRYASAVKEEYELESSGQEWLADTEESKEFVTQNTITTTVGDKDERHLEIELSANSSGNYKITKWQLIPKKIEKQGMSNLYKGGL